MKTDYVALFAACVACCVACMACYPFEDPFQELGEDEYEKHARNADVVVEPNPDLRKLLLLKKLRFREVLQDNMMSPDEILESATQEESENSPKHHKATKRRKVDDLISHVKALLSDIKQRQIKESMSLPSLRFGRSGLTYKH